MATRVARAGQAAMYGSTTGDLLRLGDTDTTNALIVDPSGICKADIGLRDGLALSIGKADNPDMRSGVTIIIRPGTEVITGKGRIITADGLDAHGHFIAPGQTEDALHSGITTLRGGGTGPGHDDPVRGSPGLWDRPEVDEL